MPASLRARLSLWNAAAFAVLLGGSGAGVYAFVAAAVGARTDAYLAQTAAALGDALADGAAADPGGAVARFRFRDIGVAVFDATPGAGAPRVLAATRTASGAAGGAPGAYPFGGPWGAGAAAAVTARAVREGPVTATLGRGPSAERVAAAARAVGRAGAPPRVLVAAASQSLGAQHAVLREAREAILAGVLLLLGVAGAGGYTVAWRGLHPIEAMSRRAARIEAGTLHERLPAAGQAAELARLAGAFNGLLARVEAAVAQQRQFMADASHELRTPVAIVRGEAELALAQPGRTEAEYRQALGAARAQAEALTRLVDDLFLLARAGAGERAAEPAPLYLEELAEECVGAARTLAAARGVALHFVPDAELPVRGDARLLRRAVLNLVDNAIKYTPAGGAVRVAVARVPGDAGLGPEAVVAPAPAAVPADLDGDSPDAPAPPLGRLLDPRWTGEFAAVAPDAPPNVTPNAVPGEPSTAPPRAAASPPRPAAWARLTVSDTGPGIPAEARGRVFERFYRARRLGAGPGDGSGAGLGLAIVAWVAAEHGGRAALLPRGAAGTTFALDLPLDGAAPAAGAVPNAAPGAPA